MRKLIISGMLFAMSAVAVPMVEARSPSSTSVGDSAQLWEQRWDRRDRRRYNRRPVTWIRTRTVRRGFRVYRVTTRYTRYRNGRIKARVIRRIRIR